MVALVRELSDQVAQLSQRNAELERVVAEQADQITELTRRLSLDSSNSSRPPSSDAPWEKKPASKRSSRIRSGRNPGKQPGASSSSRSLVDDPDRVVVIEPQRCVGCAALLGEGAESGRERRQVVDLRPVPPPQVTEYQRVWKLCAGCGTVTTPGWDTGDDCRDVVSAPGSPVRIGPEALARAALLTCGHFLPVGRARTLLKALCGIEVSIGFVAGIRGRAARKLEKKFRAHLQDLLASAPVLHADETCGRAEGALSYVHVACTEYLTLMHVGGRSAADIDAGGVLPGFTGVLIRDGYAGYSHLTAAAHAWCGAHLLRDLRSISDADPDGQLWALAMANTLLQAHHAAAEARERGADRLDADTLARIRNHYHGALARGQTDNRGKRTTLAANARTLIARFRRFEDMILRFATDLVPFTNNEAERAIRPVKLQQRTSGGCWRTLQGLIDFALVQSYLDTATKWGLDKLDVLRKLFTTGAWLPPALTPAE
ncbi:MAG: IS66 family transposase [Chloroflexota bacterium]|nr:IS66 family transposase [Chloroflexota bacterium]